MADEFENMLNEYALAVVERAQSNLRIKRRVRGKTVKTALHRAGYSIHYTTISLYAITSLQLILP